MGVEGQQGVVADLDIDAGIVPDEREDLLQQPVRRRAVGPAIPAVAWAGGQQFDVGVQPLLFSRRAQEWTGPVPPLKSLSSLGFAVRNLGTGPAECSVVYRNAVGAVERTEAVFIPVSGQVARFFQKIPLGQPGSVLIDCSQVVLPTVVIQDLANGFPTTLGIQPIE